MGISIKYCSDNPEWAARRIDELEAQLKEKFFTPASGKHEWPIPTLERISLALDFADALDYSYGYTEWVDTIKALAFAARSVRPEARLNKVDESHLLDLLVDLHRNLSETDDHGFVHLNADWREEAVESLDEAIIGLSPQSRSDKG